MLGTSFIICFLISSTLKGKGFVQSLSYSSMKLRTREHVVAITVIQVSWCKILHTGNLGGCFNYPPCFNSLSLHRYMTPPQTRDSGQTRELRCVAALSYLQLCGNCLKSEKMQRLFLLFFFSFQQRCEKKHHPTESFRRF